MNSQMIKSFIKIVSYDMFVRFVFVKSNQTFNCETLGRSSPQLAYQMLMTFK